MEITLEQEMENITLKEIDFFMDPDVPAHLFKNMDQKTYVEFMNEFVNQLERAYKTSASEISSVFKRMSEFQDKYMQCRLSDMIYTIDSVRRTGFEPRSSYITASDMLGDIVDISTNGTVSRKCASKLEAEILKKQCYECFGEMIKHSEIRDNGFIKIWFHPYYVPFYSGWEKFILEPED